MADATDILVVGAGHGGARAASTLRLNGFQGSITVVGEEPDLPYERPPLSKDYLSGAKGFDRLLLRPETFWMSKNISMVLGRRVVAVHAGQHTALLADGEAIRYGTMIWATGGRPRRLSCEGGTLAGIHSIRDRADVDHLLRELPAAHRVVVIGAGYIGLEVAAVLTKLQKHVTVLEAMDRVLPRVAGLPLSRFYEAEHRAHGVDLRFGANVTRIEGENGRASAVRLQDGTLVPADMVIVGIGILPAVGPLIDAGADGSLVTGVEIDARCRTTLPDIYAIGDCALHANAFAGGDRIRLESIQNAYDMAAIAAATIMDDGKDYHAVPTFWSNQYDLRLQTVGLSLGHDQTIVRGSPEQRSFSVIYLRNEIVVALDCVNATADFMQGRALVETGARSPVKYLADPAVPLKSLVENIG